MEARTPDLLPSNWHDSSFVADDGITLYEQQWLPPSAPSAVIIILHGFAEHSGRYARHAARLTAEGFVVEAIDLRGHGKSEGRRGYIDSCDLLVDDVVAFVGRVRERTRAADVPLFLMGHSLGATLTGLAVLRAPSDIHGLILCSPAIDIGEPLWLQRLGLLASRILPGLPSKRLNRSLLCTDENVVRESEQDPLNFHGFIRVGSAAQLVLAGRELLNRGADLELPVLIIHGTEDRLTLPVASAQLYRRSRSLNKSLSLYKGMRHETFNEPDGRQVIDRIIEFIDELRNPSTASAT